MAGLFGFDDDVKLGLLTAGLATLAGRGGPMHALGQGGLLGLGAYQNAKTSKAERARQEEQDRLQRMLMEAQIGNYQSQAQERERKILQAQQMAAAEQARQEQYGMAAQQPPMTEDFLSMLRSTGATGGLVPGMTPEERMSRVAGQMGDVPAMDKLSEVRKRLAEARPKFANTLTPGVGPDGKPAFFQPNDQGEVRAVQGAFPPPSAESSPLGKVSPGDFTPASIAKFLKSGNFADLDPIDKRPQTSVTVNNDTGPKLPPNFMWKDPRNPGAGVVPLPGGPADESERKAARAQSSLESNEVVLNALREAKKLVGYSTAGAGGAVAGMIPGTSAVDLRKRIDTVKANIGFDRLEAMRDRAKTGGALGQVAVQELAMLQATLGSLDTEQSPAQLRKTLDDIDKHFTRATALLKRIDEEAARGGGRAMSGQIGAPQVLRFDAQGNQLK